MRVLLYGMQSSGASLLALMMAQRPDSVAFCNVEGMFAAPKVEVEGDALAKVSITTAYPLDVHKARFRPDATVLVLRHPVDTYESLVGKPASMEGGYINEKFAVLERCLAERRGIDHILHYEDLIFRPDRLVAFCKAIGWALDLEALEQPRSKADIRGHNTRVWPTTEARLKYGFGRAIAGRLRRDRVRCAPPEGRTAHLTHVCPTVLDHYATTQRDREENWSAPPVRALSCDLAPFLEALLIPGPMGLRAARSGFDIGMADAVRGSTFRDGGIELTPGGPKGVARFDIRGLPGAPFNRLSGRAYAMSPHAAGTQVTVTVAGGGCASPAETELVVRHGEMQRIDLPFTNPASGTWIYIEVATDDGREPSPTDGIRFEGLRLEHEAAGGASAPITTGAADGAMQIQGFLEEISPARVVGWVMDVDHPDATLTVELQAHGRTLAQTTADGLRPDLAENDVGTARYGFVFKPQEPIAASALDGVAAVAIGRGGRRAAIPRYAPAVANPIAIGVEGLRFSPPRAIEDQQPLFILGSRRSGTSAVAQALFKFTRYSGHYEGHLLDLLAPVGEALDRFYRTKSDVIAHPDWITMIRDTSTTYVEDGIAYVLRDLASRLFPQPFWLDKTPTPEMIRASPRIAAVWPKARFVFMRRRGFENIESQGRKFPAEAFRQRCQWWAACQTAWLAARPSLSGRAIELDQRFVSTQPESAVEVLGDFLDLDPAERKGVAQALVERRPQRTEDVVDTVFDGHPPTWDADRRAIFDEICLPLFEKFGYSTDASYFVSSDPALAWRRV